MEKIDLSYPLEMLGAYREAQTLMAGLPEEMGKQALDGARRVVVEAVSQIDGASERLEQILAAETSDSLIETRESMASNREVLVKYGADTTKIDQEIAEAEERWSAFELALFLSAGAPAVASTTEILNPSPVNPEEAVTESVETKKKPEFRLSIGENKSGNTIIVMKGAKKTNHYNVAGAAANRPELKFGYVVEKLAALKIMADAPAEGLLGEQIYKAVAEILEIDPTDELDTSARGAIRNFIQTIKHGNSPLFIGDGDTKARRYKPNPKARVQTVVDYTDEDLRELDAKVKRRLSGKLELSDVDPALVNVGDLTMFLGWIDINKIVADKYIELQDGSATENLRRFFANRSDWLEMLSEVGEQTDVHVGADAEVRRLEASEKLFTLLDDQKVLDEALSNLEKELNEKGRIEFLPIVEIMQVMAGFCEDEKKLLRDIIETTVEEIVRVNQETPSSRQEIVGVKNIYHIGSKTFRIISGKAELVEPSK